MTTRRAAILPVLVLSVFAFLVAPAAMGFYLSLATSMGPLGAAPVLATSM